MTISFHLDLVSDRNFIATLPDQTNFSQTLEYKFHSRCAHPHWLTFSVSSLYFSQGASSSRHENTAHAVAFPRRKRDHVHAMFANVPVRSADTRRRGSSLGSSTRVPRSTSSRQRRCRRRRSVATCAQLRSAGESHDRSVARARPRASAILERLASLLQRVFAPNASYRRLLQAFQALAPTSCRRCQRRRHVATGRTPERKKTPFSATNIGAARRAALGFLVERASV